jgi:hypothetical protein
MKSRIDRTTALAFHKSAKSRNTPRSERSQQDQPHCANCDPDGKPLLVANLRPVRVELKVLNPSRFSDPKQPRQPAHCSYRFTVEPRPDVIRPESFLLATSSVASQLCEHVSRNAEILSNAWRRRKRQFTMYEGRSNSEFNLQHAQLAVICERLERTAFLRRHWFGRKTFLDEVLAIPHVFVAREAEEMIGDAAVGGGELDLVIVGTHGAMLANYGHHYECEVPVSRADPEQASN